MEDYYDVLRPRAEALLDHPDESVRAFAAETKEEYASSSIPKRVTGMCFTFCGRPDPSRFLFFKPPGEIDEIIRLVPLAIYFKSDVTG